MLRARLSTLCSIVQPLNHLQIHVQHLNRKLAPRCVQCTHFHTTSSTTISSKSRPQSRRRRGDLFFRPSSKRRHVADSRGTSFLDYEKISLFSRSKNKGARPRDRNLLVFLNVRRPGAVKMRKRRDTRDNDEGERARGAISAFERVKSSGKRAKSGRSPLVAMRDMAVAAWTAKRDKRDRTREGRGGEEGEA